MLMWLVRCTEKFPKAQRFKMAKRIEDAAFAFQEAIQAAGKRQDSRSLTEADIQLAILKRRLRMASEMKLIDLRKYEYISNQVAEVGRLLGAWIKRPTG
jgi:hypothetical protein